MRRGQFSRFDPTRLLPGEWAVVLGGDDGAADGRTVYVCFAAGTVKRMATIEDMAEAVQAAIEDVSDEVAQQLAAEIRAAIADAEEATESASDAANAATTAAGGADTAANGADAAAADARLAAAEARGAVRPDMALYIDYDTVGNIQYISLVDANE